MGPDPDPTIEELANDVRVATDVLETLRSTFDFDDPVEETDGEVEGSEL
jgi:hypothetical protein